MKNNKKTDIIFNIMAIVLIIVFAFAISPKTLQNDTFYTVKIGEYILENGITNQDPFSWHNISYTFPHWAYDVMIYLFYNVGGDLGVYISTITFAAILGILMYFMNNKFTNNKPISFVLSIASLYLIRNFIAARAQLFTFILFVLEVLFIENFLESGKKRYIAGLIIIPILLANFHVAVFPFYFVLYLPYIAEYIIYILSDTKSRVSRKINRLNKKISECKNDKKLNKLKEELSKLNNRLEELNNKPKKNSYKITIEKRKNMNVLIIVMIICIFTGLLTPLGTTPYTYLLKTMQGNSTNNISEHLPLTLANNLKYACVLIFFLGILTFTDTKIRLCDLFMLGGLTALTFMSRRQESMFIIICIPIFNRLVTEFVNKYDKNGIEEMKNVMASILGIIVSTCLVLAIGLLCFKNTTKSEYVDKKTYPVEASQWILENLDLDNIKLYNEYNYGSYLLFKGIPVFVDSRCDLYLPEFNKDMTAFQDFLTISSLGTKDLEGLFEKYGFTHFITYANAKLTIYFDAKPDEYNKIYNDNNFYIYEKLGA